MPPRIAIFLSGRGSNFLSIHRAIESGKLDAEIAFVASNKPDAAGLSTAMEMGYATAVFNRKEFGTGNEFSQAMLIKLHRYKVEFIVLAGYLRKIPAAVIQSYRNRIVNIHPALLPKHGGKGMYGLKVHQAVLDAGELQTGVTVHLVDEQYDHGTIIEQQATEVLPDDTAESLAKRVLKVEHEFYPKVLKKLLA